MYTKLSLEQSHTELEDIDRRLAWRAGLKDVDVRSLAFEYRQREAKVASGELQPDQCLSDAWAEYQERFGSHGSPSTEFLKKAKMDGRRNRKKAQFAPRKS